MSHDSVMRATVTNAPENLPSTPTTRLVGHEGPVKVVRFSACGKYCITGGHDRTVRLWNPSRIDPVENAASQARGSLIDSSLSSEKNLDRIPPALPIQLYSDGHTHGVAAVDIDDTSTTLLSASDKALVITDVISRKLKRRFQGHSGRINSVACSSGGDLFLSGSYDGTVRIWDGKSGSSNPVQILSDASDSVSCVKVVQNESTTTEIITTSIDGCIRIYDVRKGLLNVHDLGKDVALNCISYTSDGMCNAISCLNGAVHVIEHQTGCLLNTCFGGHTAGRYSLECCVTADDHHIACGSENGAAVLYNFESGKVAQTLQGHGRATCSVACHPHRNHSSVVITASYDGNAVVWTNGSTAYASLD